MAAHSLVSGWADYCRDQTNVVTTSPPRLERGFVYNFFVSFLTYYLMAYALNRLPGRRKLGMAPVVRTPLFARRTRTGPWPQGFHLPTDVQHTSARTITNGKRPISLILTRVLARTPPHKCPDPGVRASSESDVAHRVRTCPPTMDR